MARMVLANVQGEVGMPAAAEALQAGASALDVLEAGIRPVEADGTVGFVGRGGDPNLLGELECDAALMSGASRRVGSVGAVKHCLHAVTLARHVMEKLPHVMLVGDGATRFARELGIPRTEMLTEEARAAWREWLAAHLPAAELERLNKIPLARHTWPSATPRNARGTTVFLTVDANGDLAAGTSTSGWSYKYPGRLGDSPIVGAGLYADNRYGACACTHTGELTVRASTSAAVVFAMRAGATVSEACHEAAADLATLSGGYVGPVVIHAIDRAGEACVVAVGFEDAPPPYFLWTEGGPGIERRRPVVAQP